MRLLFFLAVLPSILLARSVLEYDRIESEPARMLIRLFVLGMLTCIPSALIESAGVTVITGITSSPAVISMLTYLILVPGAEETMKYLALRTTRRSKEFNYTFDGIVYGVMVSLGFATLENILYVLELQSLQTAVMRGLMSVPLHCACGVFMGYYFGVSRGQEVRGERREAQRASRLTLMVPWIVHGLYDYYLDTDSLLLFLLGLAFTAIVFWVAKRQVRQASANDEPIMVSLSSLSEPLPPESEGVRMWDNKRTPPPPFNR